MSRYAFLSLFFLLSGSLALTGLNIQAEGGWDNRVGNIFPYFIALNGLIPLNNFSAIDAGIKYRLGEPGLDAAFISANFEFNIDNSYTFGFKIGDCLLIFPASGPLTDHLFFLGSIRAGFVSIYSGAEMILGWNGMPAAIGCNFLYRAEFHIFTYSGIPSPFRITLGFSDYFRYEYDSFFSPLADIVFTYVFSDTVAIGSSGRIKHFPGLFAGLPPEYSISGDLALHY